MGTCISKKRRSYDAGAVVTPGTKPAIKCSNNGVTAVKPTQLLQAETQNELQWGKRNGNQEKEAVKDENSIVVKKEVFAIRHRKSHDRSSDQAQHHASPVSSPAEAAPPTISGEIGKIRTSSCTKEEVDAILIQCGRLSRSSSKAHHGRKYSGSKRSFEFDNSDKDALAGVVAAAVDGDDRRNTHLADNEDDGDPPERRLRHRQRNRQSPRPSPSRERRRTHSREREPNSLRERRVSRSPGRRSSETSGNSAVDTTIPNINNHDGSRKPATMVSVPATVTSLAMEKTNNVCDSISASAVKRISVKRNAVVSSPRSQSPARITTYGKVSDENVQQHQASLSRSSSRKAEQSPYRRNALSEIDPNCIPHSQELNRNGGKSKKESESDGILTINALNQKPKVEAGMNGKVVIQGTTKAVNGNITTTTPTTMAEPKDIDKVQQWMPATAEPVKPQPLTRTRSSRRSRDLDMNPDTSSYTTLLLEDIHNFHQKNTIPVSLPPCLTKACSILEAVADLNSTTSSNLSCTLSEDRTNPASFGANLVGISKEMPSNKDPFVESEVAVEDDVMEPSFHNFISISRGDGDGEDQESSGSNSFTGIPPNRPSIMKSVNSKEEGRQRNGRMRKEIVREKERLVSISRQ